MNVTVCSDDTQSLALPIVRSFRQHLQCALEAGYRTSGEVRTAMWDAWMVLLRKLPTVLDSRRDTLSELPRPRKTFTEVMTEILARPCTEGNDGYTAWRNENSVWRRLSTSLPKMLFIFAVGHAASAVLAPKLAAVISSSATPLVRSTSELAVRAVSQSVVAGNGLSGVAGNLLHNAVSGGIDSLVVQPLASSLHAPAVAIDSSICKAQHRVATLSSQHMRRACEEMEKEIGARVVRCFASEGSMSPIESILNGKLILDMQHTYNLKCSL